MTGAQLTWDQVAVGDVLPSVAFPLSVYRLVVVAGANRDFNAIHHNSAYARRTGADEMYANTLFLQGMWERVVRDYVGSAGTIRSLRGFRMRTFNYVGDTATVEGQVTRTWLDDEDSLVGLVELTLLTRNGGGVSVGPGTVVATLPRSAPGAG
jgi:acyl dehydratase